MKKVAIIPLALGVFVGGAAIKMGLDALQKAKADSVQEMIHVVVATDEIPATSQITRTMVTVVESPVTPLVGQDAFTDLDKVIGRVVGSSIPRGGVLRESLLAPDGTPAGLAVRIKKGFRAVSVRVNEVTGVAYQIRPGAFVDVIAVMTVNEGRRKETVSRIILQDIEVAAVGRTLSSPNASKAKAAKSVTLLVKDTDAPKLHLAQTRGKLTLALRSEDDKLTARDGHSTESDLLGELGKKLVDNTPKPKPVAKPIPPRPYSVTVVQGNSRRQHVFGTQNAPTSTARGGAAQPPAASMAQPPAGGQDHNDGEKPPPPDFPG